MGCFKKKNESENEEQSRKPSDSPFKQQKMRAWQPVLTASTVLPIFFLIGVVFLPIGISLLVTSNNIKETVIDYTSHNSCKKCVEQDEDPSKRSDPKILDCSCEVTFSLDSKWEEDVYFYYGLSNFYQNHRRYVRSRDDSQLHGTLSSSVNSNCKPFDKGPYGPFGNLTRSIAPCGAIANSMFTDTFKLEWSGEKVPILTDKIAWNSDRETKFKNPSNINDFDKYAKPLAWKQSIKSLDNQLKNEAFMVWMRVAAFPTFRKLYGRLNKQDSKSKTFQDGLKSGEYKLSINYTYPVKSFGGEKRFVLTTSSWIGGKNPFLGTCYIVIGCLCLLFGFVFLFIHMNRTKNNTR